MVPSLSFGRGVKSWRKSGDNVKN